MTFKVVKHNLAREVSVYSLFGWSWLSMKKEWEDKCERRVNEGEAGNKAESAGVMLMRARQQYPSWESEWSRRVEGSESQWRVLLETHACRRLYSLLLHTYTCACRWLSHSTQCNTDNRNQTPNYEVSSFNYEVFMKAGCVMMWDGRNVFWLHIFIFSCYAVDFF